jgi:DNA polymerase III subunit epsilon
MTRVLGLDFETTGLDTSKDRIIEVGAILWEVETKRPLVTLGLLYRDETTPPLTEETVRITGITDDNLKEFGTAPKPNLEWLDKFCHTHRVEYLVAHNGNSFDKPLLMAELDRYGLPAPTLRSLPWLDTRWDLPFATEPDSRKLKHLALDVGVVNSFPHRALTDVFTMMLVLSHYPFDDVVAASKIPMILVRAMVEFKDKEKAKAKQYRWTEVGEYKRPGCWIKLIRENKFEDEKKLCDFPVIRIE